MVIKRLLQNSITIAPARLLFHTHQVVNKFHRKREVYRYKKYFHPRSFLSISSSNGTNAIKSVKTTGMGGHPSQKKMPGNSISNQEGML